MPTKTERKTERKTELKTLLLIAVLVVLPLAARAMDHIKAIEVKGRMANIMDCEITSSEYVSVQVLQLEDKTFVLKTLDNAGSPEFFALTKKEWPATKIMVPCWKSPASVCGELNVQGDKSWGYEITGTTGVAVGNCHEAYRR